MKLRCGKVELDFCADFKMFFLFLILMHDLDPGIIQQYGTEGEVNPLYHGRSSMSADTVGFFYRDFSLTLRKPRPSDSGIYTCIFSRKNHDVGVVEVDLKVLGTWIVFPLIVVAVVLVVAVGVAAYLWSTTITVFQVKVKEGEGLVKLPYRTMVQLPECVAVEWIRCAPDPMKVHVYHNERNRRVSQDEIYRGRTSMRADCLRTRDLGLTLRDPCYRDSGTFLCTVYIEQHVLAQRAVRLQVQVVEEEVNVLQSSKTFTLPFITTAQLPEDATVEWRRYWPGDTVVHVFENGKDQPYRQDENYRGQTMMNSNPLRSKDLSVTVTSSGFSDRGRYRCSVRREGNVLARKEVKLLVDGQ
ncbi:uncharacterized protein LOC121526328 isoform X2 [Cheilinus undulatus]|uniref:uncharacterized protein LOC121526328 isoform X2 n=1 Tax=Cheilinus undulatus TaxID=241271 RepID=UPI001BD29F14|nr:uncharacterized protein LOC121526328 isoform X2 [Cheilinus undulatus]